MSDNAPTQTHGLPLPRETCLICQQESPLSELVALGCSHVYHPECITRWWEMSPPKTCPYCKQKASCFRHACGQPGATTYVVPDAVIPFQPGPLPVCLPCEACGELSRLLEAVPDRDTRVAKLVESVYHNQASLRSLLSPYDATDLGDYDQWRKRDVEEMGEKGTFHYCQRSRPCTTAASTALLPDNGRRRRLYREQPETTTTASYQHHLRHLGRITRAELAYACDTEDLHRLGVAAASRGGGGAAYTQWRRAELPNLNARRRDLEE